MNRLSHEAPLSQTTLEHLDEARSLVAAVGESNPNSVRDQHDLTIALAGLAEAITTIVAAEGEPDYYGSPATSLELLDDIETYPLPFTDTPLVTGRLFIEAPSESYIKMTAEVLADEQHPSARIVVPTNEQSSKYSTAAYAVDYRGGGNPEVYFPLHDTDSHPEDAAKYFAILRELCNELASKTNPATRTF